MTTRDPAAAKADAVLVHARSAGQYMELRISRFERGEWIIGRWAPVEEPNVRVTW